MSNHSWINVKEKLPENNQKILTYDGIRVKIAIFEKGLTNKEREKMKRGEIPDEKEHVWRPVDGFFETKRSEIYKASDEWGNNEKGYCWRIDDNRVFGQNIEWWMPIPESPMR